MATVPLSVVAGVFIWLINFSYIRGEQVLFFKAIHNSSFVTPAKAGAQCSKVIIDSGMRRNDVIEMYT
jgi:hypothetical protein